VTLEGQDVMHLILTHEQADFDAIASLLAANLLNPEGIAVLPRRLNRNVRAYLTLYGDRLPFIEFEDLPRDPIESVTLVDTQNMPSLKGFHADTKVFVIDHHPFNPELPNTWTTQIEETGATATLLVEGIQDLESELDLVSATLLLVGIYEDTGSLTYGGTTPRDVRACAWLLDHGASLKIASDFLNHPLSAEQQKLYDLLFESAETFSFHGMTVVVAHGSARGFVDEISTIAHKLRDIFDPTGLFVLVGLNEHVQLVARSTADELDVSEVAGYFGGGGHSRAAAALIREGSVETVREELLRILPDIIRPEKTVGEIMSRGPQLLSPSTTVVEASEKMQRFGYEGYPVVDKGKVIGLLTRRAVDRAMSHDMGNMAVTSVMNAGTLFVHPSDSIQRLQQVMIENDWGQVPVIHPEKGEIVGIVTRTDLLKTLADAEGRTDKSNLTEQLESALTPTVLRLLKLVAQHAEKENAALYIVGGFVRDLLLGAPSVDFDLVVEGNAIHLAQSLAVEFGGRVSSHKRFGTAKWALEPEHPHFLAALNREHLTPGELPSSLDLVSARTEFYRHPTALPSVERGSIKLDLHRRDFSINTLALRLDGRHYGDILDHWGGGRDLREGFIRVLHSLSFIDDPTRMLRAVRLEQRLGFHIEPRTLELLQEALPLLDRVSGDRIRNELDSIFEEQQVKAIMQRLDELGLLSAIHPKLTWNENLENTFDQVVAFSPPKRWRISSIPSNHFFYYALLMSSLKLRDVREICDRLHFSAVMRNCIVDANWAINELPRLCSALSPSRIVEKLDDLRQEALFVVWVGMPDRADCREVIDKYLSEWRFVSPKTTGDTLREMGLPPSSTYRKILQTLRNAWLDGEVDSLKEEDALLSRLVKEAKRQN
jgi:tRNA nucleotidyltransferase (CCA-adding enzyme)